MIKTLLFVPVVYWLPSIMGAYFWTAVLALVIAYSYAVEYGRQHKF